MGSETGCSAGSAGMGAAAVAGRSTAGVARVDPAPPSACPPPGPGMLPCRQRFPALPPTDRECPVAPAPVRRCRDPVDRRVRGISTRGRRAAGGRRSPGCPGSARRRCRCQPAALPPSSAAPVPVGSRGRDGAAGPAAAAAARLTAAGRVGRMFQVPLRHCCREGPGRPELEARPATQDAALIMAAPMPIPAPSPIGSIRCTIRNENAQASRTRTPLSRPR